MTDPRPQVISGLRAFHGEGWSASRGFWAEAWGQVIRRPRAAAALTWTAVVAFFAVFAPLLSSGHPWLLREVSADGAPGPWSSPLVEHLTTLDWLLLVWTITSGLVLALPRASSPRAARLGIMLLLGAQAAVIALLAGFIHQRVSSPDVSDAVRAMEQRPWFIAAAVGGSAAVVSLVFLAVPVVQRFSARLALVAAVGTVTAVVVAGTWRAPLEIFPYREQQAAGTAQAIYTLNPFSPAQRRGDLDLRPPGSRYTPPGTAAAPAPAPRGMPIFILGTDSLGQDVLAHVLHACRLSISIGLVSTTIALLIGVTLGALMGYFGGVVDLVLYRLVEIVMGVPVLFLLIVAASVLPRNTYVMMAIIGCFTWTGAARYTRAEFMRLRNMEFVHAARALGLPVRSILFRHMLPNGVAPVLVDASFAIAAAILIEATLSYLGLGPEGQPSWGRLLADATGSVGDFVWWLAVFPAGAIFLTVLSYNLVGEALRDAIDPKLKKARASNDSP